MRKAVQRCLRWTFPLEANKQGTQMEVPKYVGGVYRGTFWGVPIIRIIVFWGLDWGPPFWETTIWHFHPNSDAGSLVAFLTATTLKGPMRTW